MIKKLFVALMMVCALAANTAMAVDKSAIDSTAWEKLTPAQRAEIAKQVAVTAESSSAVSSENIDKYVDMGERIGKMLGGAAKELGVAVNTFAETPVGKWTMAVAVWKLVGNDLKHVFAGIMILSVGIGVITTVFRARRRTSIEYFPERTLGIFRRVKSVQRPELDTDDAILYLIATGILFVVTIWVTFAG